MKNTFSVSPYSTVFNSHFQQMHFHSRYSAYCDFVCLVSVADSDVTSVNWNLFQCFKLIKLQCFNGHNSGVNQNVISISCSCLIKPSLIFIYCIFVHCIQHYRITEW